MSSFFCVVLFCVGKGLTVGRSPVQESSQHVYSDSEFQKFVLNRDRSEGLIHETWTYIRGPFAKFVDSPYYSESELCGGAVTVSFSKYVSWQAMHFIQRSTHCSKTCCRPLITWKFLASELSFRVWKNPEIAWGEI
jgi:hypothetical protein